MRVVVVGDVMNDVVVRALGPVEVGSDTNSEVRTSPGGSGANQAAWLASLGIPVSFYGRVGEADAEEHARWLELAGADARLATDREVPTGSIVVLVADDGERSMFTDRGANRRLGADDLPLDMNCVRHLHVSGYALFEARSRSAVVDLIAGALARSVSVSIDPSSESYLRQLGPEEFLSATAGTETIFPNAPEARLLSGRAGDEEAASALTATYPIVVVKLGRAGALLATRDAPLLRVDASPARIVDTTGAGDAFCAGYLAARLTGAAPHDAVRAAVETAAFALGHMGGRPVPPPVGGVRAV